LRAVNEDRPGKDVSRRAAILDLAVNGTLISGTTLGGTAPDWSISTGSSDVAVSIVTMSPELIVSTGLSAALK
jgi:hypothetical protein